MRRVSCYAAAIAVLLAAASVAAQPTSAPTSSNSTNSSSPTSSSSGSGGGGACTRDRILTVINAIPNTTTASSAIGALNASALLPDQRQGGTLFLPTDKAFEDLGIPVGTLLANYSGQLLSILAYHSLIGQERLYRRTQLVRAGKIQSDLGILEDALNGTKNSFELTFEKSNSTKNTTFGGETLRGFSENNTAVIGGGKSQKVCGLIVYPISAVLIPAATLQDVPDNLGTALAALQQPGSSALAGSSAGLAAAVAAGNVTLSENGTSSVVAGQALPLEGDGGTVNTTKASLLAGTVTPENGTAVGPGLFYLNGTVTNGTGDNGTATPIVSLTRAGAVLNRTASVDLAGASVNGTAFDAEGTRIRNGASGGNSSASGFGTPLETSDDGTFNSTGAVLFDGNITDGKALSSNATGSAADGSLGPGAIYVNGTVKDGKGSSGSAYPVVSLSNGTLTVNRDNGLNITGATFEGTPYNATGLTVRRQSSDGPGGAGAASEPATSASGPSSGGGGGGSTSGGASGPGGSPSEAPAPAPQAAITSSSVPLAAAVALAGTVAWQLVA